MLNDDAQREKCGCLTIRQPEKTFYGSTLWVKVIVDSCENHEFMTVYPYKYK